ncbi:2-amino-4-hydroxy-6-hydroxymethyldihydropteridine diphosphokinase [Clostridium sp. D2Q-14]|uniref:2-amino-4-hydroxy-6- hydroxymethyldihydropteridine diphosphokinase n=1 Tax=Anaeromonas gelatinilytica TaxID=2683194 RepID=UPI00193BCD66|nr:2-amino-4-hydroxy-6-hydroxymethyldihydropteridine diphosphokinase [Anaeromonas gelatinilytica]MBS4536525.1 2-amino-4-hydroxy-6-hydroxymethyldihydropteridine diphosphokinase [Anaeromonas gelatinilytica]
MIAYIGLGSNLGEREKFLKKAQQFMKEEGITILKCSKIRETLPYGYVNQPLFLNQVVEVETDLSPFELLERMQKIENMLGREREEHWGPRTIDLDILFYGDEIIESPLLIVPHKEIQNRLFVLEPMVELNANCIHPVFNVTMITLYEQLLEKLSKD